MVLPELASGTRVLRLNSSKIERRPTPIMNIPRKFFEEAWFHVRIAATPQRVSQTVGSVGSGRNGAAAGFWREL